MALTFACPRCDRSVPVQSSDDDLPDVLVKVRRVERGCQACGETVRGLDTPDACPNESCPDPGRGWASAERVVTEAVSVALCSDCQDDLDTAAEIEAALAS